MDTRDYDRKFNYGNEDCDCDEDNNCGCSFPNNISDFTCNCTPDANCGCIEFDKSTASYVKHSNKCSCTSNQKS